MYFKIMPVVYKGYFERIIVLNIYIISFFFQYNCIFNLFPVKTYILYYVQ